MHTTAHELKVRRYAAALAECPGWTEWALPLLRQVIGSLRTSILENSGLSSERVMQERHAYKVLTERFLNSLRQQAEGAFHTSLPLIHTDELDSTLPAPEIIREIVAAFSHDEASAPSATPQPAPPPPEVAAFDPFSGLPQPLRTTPSPPPP